MTKQPVDEGFAHAKDADDYTIKGVLDQVSKRDDLQGIVVFMFTENGMQIANSIGVSRDAWALASVFAARHATADFDDWTHIERGT